MSYITINKANYFHNLRQITGLLPDKKNLILILKDNAYGHGARQMAALASEFGIVRAAVKNTKEALEIEEFFDEILVLSSHIDEHIKNEKFIYAINDARRINELENGVNYALKLDSGMRRNGIVADELGLVLRILQQKNIAPKMAFTHIAGECSVDFQLATYKKMREMIGRIFDKTIFHCANSQTLIAGKNIDDFARVGLVQFGYGDASLKPVLSLIARQHSRRVLKKGEGIGYDFGFVAERDYLVGTYDLGYGDGLPTNFYKCGERRGETFCVQAKSGKIVGKISMDSFSAICDEAEFVLFDDAESFAEQFGMNAYEILVRLSPKIEKRIF